LRSKFLKGKWTLKSQTSDLTGATRDSIIVFKENMTKGVEMASPDTAVVTAVISASRDMEEDSMTRALMAIKIAAATKVTTKEVAMVAGLTDFRAGDTNNTETTDSNSMAVAMDTSKGAITMAVVSMAEAIAIRVMVEATVTTMAIATIAAEIITAGIEEVVAAISLNVVRRHRSTISITTPSGLMMVSIQCHISDFPYLYVS